MPQINFRITEQEKESLQKSADKTSSTLSDYCKKLILGYEVENITQEHTISALIELWEQMQAKGIQQEIIDQLKQIILECK